MLLLCVCLNHTTATKIGPESFYFDSRDATATNPRQRYYILRPEVIEGYFYMWRLTKDPKYREWGWEAAQVRTRLCSVVCCPLLCCVGWVVFVRSPLDCIYWGATAVFTI